MTRCSGVGTHFTRSRIPITLVNAGAPRVRASLTLSVPPFVLNWPILQEPCVRVPFTLTKSKARNTAMEELEFDPSMFGMKADHGSLDVNSNAPSTAAEAGASTTTSPRGRGGSRGNGSINNRGGGSASRGRGGFHQQQQRGGPLMTTLQDSQRGGRGGGGGGGRGRGRGRGRGGGGFQPPFHGDQQQQPFKVCTLLFSFCLTTGRS